MGCFLSMVGWLAAFLRWLFVVANDVCWGSCFGLFVWRRSRLLFVRE